MRIFHWPVELRPSRSRRGRVARALGSACLIFFLAPGCSDDEEQMTAKALQGELASCKEGNQRLQGTIDHLKRQLAQALTNPSNVKLAEVEISGDLATALEEGRLRRAAVVRTVEQGKGALQGCYNRALKRNSDLHHQELKLDLSFTVEPSGAPVGISLRPSYDAEMTNCMRKAIQQWRFPSFSGQPVGVETPVRLTPSSG